MFNDFTDRTKLPCGLADSFVLMLLSESCMKIPENVMPAQAGMKKHWHMTHKEPAQMHIQENTDGTKKDGLIH